VHAYILLWDKEKQIAEGAGAVSVALIIENKDLFIGNACMQHAEIVAVTSGGNIEDKLFRSILASETTKTYFSLDRD